MSFVDSHYFHIKTLEFQSKVETWAKQQAQQCQDPKITAAKADRFSRQICQNAYNLFNKNLSTEFQSDIYKNLISLTMDSRINYFFVLLQDRVSALILEKHPVEES